MRHRSALIMSGLCLVPFATAAHAESVSLVGEFPARAREASFLTRMGVDRIGGQDGQALAIAIERTLSNGSPPFFTVISMGRMGGPRDVDGLVSGNVVSDVADNRVTREKDECIEKTGDKCTKSQKVKITCRQRIIDVSADVRIVRARDGSIAYSERKGRRDDVTWCPDQNPPPPVEGIIRGMIDGIAGEIAGDITPATQRYSIRFYESRDGLPKELGQRFKDAIKRTKADLAGACQEFAAIDQASPGQFSIAYDLGICAEARGDYDVAIRQYQAAAQARPRDRTDFTAGIDRAQRLIIGRDDARERARRR